MHMSPTTTSLLRTCVMSPLRTTRHLSCLSSCCCRPRNCKSLVQLINALTSTIRTTANMMTRLSTAPDVRSVGSATHTPTHPHGAHHQSNKPSTMSSLFPIPLFALLLPWSTMWSGGASSPTPSWASAESDRQQFGNILVNISAVEALDFCQVWNQAGVMPRDG